MITRSFRRCHDDANNMGTSKSLTHPRKSFSVIYFIFTSLSTSLSFACNLLQSMSSDWKIELFGANNNCICFNVELRRSNMLAVCVEPRTKTLKMFFFLPFFHITKSASRKMSFSSVGEVIENKHNEFFLKTIIFAIAEKHCWPSEFPEYG